MTYSAVVVAVVVAVYWKLAADVCVWKIRFGSKNALDCCCCCC